MNYLDFSVLNGWPLNSTSLKFLQESLTALQVVSALGGQNFVISGCTVDGSNNVSAGFVCINGEILPFQAGPLNTHVVVVDNPSNKLFENGNSNPYYHERHAQFGSGTGQVAWADLERNDVSNALLKRMRTAEAKIDTNTDGVADLYNKVSDLQDQVDGKAGTQEVADNYLNKAGGVMTGNIKVPTDPSEDRHVVTRAWVQWNYKAQTYNLGDVNGVTEITIPLPEPVTVGGYMVVGNLLSLDRNNIQNDCNVTWCLISKTTTSFNIVVRELGVIANTNGIQNLQFEYLIIKY